VIKPGGPTPNVIRFWSTRSFPYHHTQKPDLFLLLNFLRKPHTMYQISSRHQLGNSARTRTTGEGKGERNTPQADASQEASHNPH